MRHTRCFSCVVGVSFTDIQVHMPWVSCTQTRNNNLWITQRVAPCGNRTRYTLRGSQLPSHRANCAVNRLTLRLVSRVSTLILFLAISQTKEEVGARDKQKG
uniref:SFRICE_028054 n=1 Tax=Spodoptera frugiperda TaxID=7108 RepID=A0A2H1WQ71_SPOFR